MTSLWIVTSRDGPDLACETRGQAMEHCAIMAGDFPQCAPWNVTKYVPASDLAAAKDARDLAQTSGVTTSNYWKQRADDMESDLAAAKATIRRLAISSVTANPGTLHHYKCAACGGRWSGRPTDAEQHAAGCDAAIAGGDK